MSLTRDRRAWRGCRGWTGGRGRRGWRDWRRFRDKKAKSTMSRSRRRGTKRNCKTSRKPLKVLAKNDTVKTEIAKKVSIKRLKLR